MARVTHIFLGPNEKEYASQRRTHAPHGASGAGPFGRMGAVSLPNDAEVSVRDVSALLDAGAALLDVREPDEWQAGHAERAVHVPLRRLTPDAIPPGDPLLVVCHVGGRSAMATMALQRAGYPAVNVAGGMEAWQSAGLPVVTDDGAPGVVV